MIDLAKKACEAISLRAIFSFLVKVPDIVAYCGGFIAEFEGGYRKYNWEAKI